VKTSRESPHGRFWQQLERQKWLSSHVDNLLRGNMFQKLLWGSIFNNRKDQNGWTMVLIIGNLWSVASLAQTSDMLQDVIHQYGNITVYSIYQTWVVRHCTVNVWTVHFIVWNAEATLSENADSAVIVKRKWLWILMIARIWFLLQKNL
jgi:hypothetical protein